MWDPTPVSYTHLDVYKRQIIVTFMVYQERAYLNSSINIMNLTNNIWHYCCLQKVEKKGTLNLHFWHVRRDITSLKNRRPIGLPTVKYINVSAITFNSNAYTVTSPYNVPSLIFKSPVLVEICLLNLISQLECGIKLFVGSNSVSFWHSNPNLY